MTDIELQQVNQMLDLAVRKKGLAVAGTALMLQQRLQTAQVMMPVTPAEPADAPPPPPEPEAVAGTEPAAA